MKNWERIIICSLSTSSFLFSLIVLCRCFPRLIEIPNETGFDYIGFIVGTLSFLVAILAIMFGYNIFDFKGRVKEEINRETQKFETKMVEMERRIRGYSEYLTLLQSYFRHRDLAVKYKNDEQEADYIITGFQNLFAAYGIGIITQQSDIKDGVISVFRIAKQMGEKYKKGINEAAKYSIEKINEDRSKDERSEEIMKWIES